LTDAVLVGWASQPIVLAILLAWGFGESVALPIVPDVLLGLMALATPAALGVPLVAAIAGALVGSVALADLHRRRPDVVARIIALQPGLGQRGMAEARTRIERAGAARGFVQVGPGLPLRAYVVALIEGFGEAVALPIVPDVLLGLLALATPAALGVPLVAAIAGAVVGSVVLADLHRRRPDLVSKIIAVQPSLGQRGMAEARTRIERAGAARGFAQVGPGLPLKAYVVALIESLGDPGPSRLAGLATINRLTRLVPVVAGFALVGVLARAVDVSVSSAVPVYVAGWTVFYLAFWWVRRG